MSSVLSTNTHVLGRVVLNNLLTCRQGLEKQSPTQNRKGQIEVPDDIIIIIIIQESCSNKKGEFPEPSVVHIQDVNNSLPPTLSATATLKINSPKKYDSTTSGLMINGWVKRVHTYTRMKLRKTINLDQRLLHITYHPRHYYHFPHSSFHSRTIQSGHAQQMWFTINESWACFIFLRGGGLRWHNLNQSNRVIVWVERGSRQGDWTATFASLQIVSHSTLKEFGNARNPSAEVR